MKRILIVGAGPSGLATGIFLSELGYKPAIIDKKESIGKYSKALGVNPRTLEILEKFGIAERFLNNGRRMNCINFWDGELLIYKNDLTKAPHKYPFMIVQSQKESEEILLDELQKRGINVIYNTELNSFKYSDSAYEIKTNVRKLQNIKFDIVIGADGGHSKVRETLGIDYDGFSYEGTWKLYDVELTTELDNNDTHIIIFNGGCIFMLRLNENTWRVAGNLDNLLDYIPKNTKIGKVHWESDFRVHHNIAKSLIRKNAIIIGDAAHLHSPVGARGMNLGIEDAFIASNLIHENRLFEYQKIRKPYIEKTVNKINSMTMLLAGNSSINNSLRRNTWLLKFIFPIVIPKARKFLMGIDKQNGFLD